MQNARAVLNLAPLLPMRPAPNEPLRFGASFCDGARTLMCKPRWTGASRSSSRSFKFNLPMQLQVHSIVRTARTVLVPRLPMSSGASFGDGPRSVLCRPRCSGAGAGVILAMHKEHLNTFFTCTGGKLAMACHAYADTCQISTHDHTGWNNAHKVSAL